MSMSRRAFVRTAGIAASGALLLNPYTNVISQEPGKSSKEPGVVGQVYKLVEDRELPTRNTFKKTKGGYRFELGVYPVADRLVFTKIRLADSYEEEKFTKIGNGRLGDNPQDRYDTESDAYGAGHAAIKPEHAELFDRYLRDMLPVIENTPLQSKNSLQNKKPKR